MTELVTKMVEFVGFDVLFLGSVTLFACLVADVLRRWISSGGPLNERFIEAKNYLGALLFRGAAPTTAQMAFLIFIATLGGMVSNLAADELLDGPTTLSFLTWRHATVGDCRDDQHLLGEEDCIKLRAVDKAKNLHVLSLAQQTITAHAAERRDATAIVQHAYATLLGSKDTNILTLLRFEFLVVKTLRVLWLDVLLLLIPTALASLMSLKGRKLAGLGRSIPVAAFLIASQFFLLWLWHEQSGRYYLKLLHSYMVLSTDKGLVVTGAAPSAREFTDLKTADGMIAYGEFTNTRESKTQMFELSAVSIVAKKIIIADNETGTLTAPLGRIKDAGPLSLFEAAIDSQKKTFSLTRAWPSLFGGWTEKEYDDIEGLAATEAALYLIGSHSLDKMNAVRNERKVIIRIQIGKDGVAIGPPLVFRGLMPLLFARAHDLGLVPDRDHPGIIKDLNIEGLSLIPGTNDLLIGLRSPLVQGKAAMLRLAHADALFGAAPQYSPANLSLYHLLDLQGQGITGLEYDGTLRSFLVASGPPLDVPQNQLVTRLWRWKTDGDDAKLSELMRFPGHKLEGAARLEQGSLILAFDEEVGEKQFGRLLAIKEK